MERVNTGMKVSRGTLLLAFLAIAPGLLFAGDRRRVRLGGVSVGASYTSGFPYYGYGPGYGYYPAGFAPWSLFSPFWYSPWMHPGLYGGFDRQAEQGQVRLEKFPESGFVYIDGAFAGTVAKLRKIWLDPGAYRVEVRENDHAVFDERVYVLSGKSLPLRSGQTAGGRPRS